MRTRTAYFGVFTALALIFSYIETLIPFHIGIPGVKLGLANLIVIVALYMTDTKTAYLLAVARVVLAGFLFGNLFSILYSLAGSLLSVTVMSLVRKHDGFSRIGVSIAGGVFHNIGQLLVAAAVLESYYIFYYVPVLLMAGLLTGLLIGVAADAMLVRLRSIRIG